MRRAVAGAAMTPDGQIAKALRLPLGETARAGLRAAGGDEADLSSAVRAAIHYYLADKPSGRAGWAVPGSLPEPAASTPVEVTVAMPAATWEELSREAREQGVTRERVVHHATLYFVADLDAGRVAGRIVDDLRSP